MEDLATLTRAAKQMGRTADVTAARNLLHQVRDLEANLDTRRDQLDAAIAALVGEPTVGFTQTQIARLLGLNKQTVGKWIKRHQKVTA